MKVNEALLEMIYFAPLRELFETYLNRPIKSIYKPSPRREALLGFDQAWITCEISEDEFEYYLNGTGSTSSFYAYLLQFKIVTKQNVSEKARFRIQETMRSPYCRSRITTTISNTSTRGILSQHELLHLWKQNHPNMEVHYACPMIFDTSEIFSPNYNEYLIDNLVLADLGNAPDPDSWDLNEKHHLMWNSNLYEENSDESVYWCSEPIKGEFLFPKKFVEQVCLQKIDSTQLQDILKDLKDLNNLDIHHNISITILEVEK